MAHAYIPGLKVLTYSDIEKQRILPIKGEVLTKKGAKVGTFFFVENLKKKF